jgi:hypothetical protein
MGEGVGGCDGDGAAGGFDAGVWGSPGLPSGKAQVGMLKTATSNWGKGVQRSASWVLGGCEVCGTAKAVCGVPAREFSSFGVQSFPFGVCFDDGFSFRDTLRRKRRLRSRGQQICSPAWENAPYSLSAILFLEQLRRRTSGLAKHLTMCPGGASALMLDACISSSSWFSQTASPGSEQAPSQIQNLAVGRSVP